MASAVVLALAAPATATAPFSFDTAPGRLPKNVVPIDYQITVTPNATQRTLTGKETIRVRVRSTTPTIVMNSLNERLTNVRLDGTLVKHVVSSDPKQLTTITLAKPAKVGLHTLTFAYTGKIETAPQGLFAQPYQKPNDGGAGLMLSTQFEATDARRMFPCWDEPAFRATFTLTAVVPAAWATVSNMPIAKRVVRGTLAATTFERSPKMPTYLVEFSAGDLAEITAAHDGTNFGVWAVKGQEHDGAIALANAQTILSDYNAYFGVKFPLPKLDSIAVPGGFQGAMENWGAITYNDQALLVNSSSTIGNKQTVFSIQAHEMAHQWNGDLVTMGWWDDIWLNESFASWMAAKETDLRNPTWNWWERQDGSKEGAMDADAHVNSHPIEQHVSDELQAMNSFDPQITYAKGQAFLRMLEAYMTPDVFRSGVRMYMQDRKYSNATSGDLWKWLSKAAGTDIASVAAAWTEQPGFPIVSVHASCDASGKRTLTFTQKRFLLDGTDPKNSHWSVPLVIRSGANGTSQRLLLTKDGQTTAAGSCSEPLSANAGTIGFYRVKYDDATMRVNTANFGSLPNGDRIGLLDDTWAEASAGQAKLPEYLALASAMGNDLDTRAWDQITQSLATIEHDERGTSGHGKFVAYARSIVRPVYDQLGWDTKANETPGVQQLRRTALSDLGAWGDPDVIAEARKRFAGFVANRAAVSPDDQGPLLDIVAINADAATFDQLHAIAKSAKNETEVRRYYGALMLVRDPNLATKALQIALGPEIPAQAASIRLRLVGVVGGYNPQLSWETFKKNYALLTAPLGPFSSIAMAQYIPAGYWNAAPLDEIEAWVKSKISPEMLPNLARGMESARFSLQEKTTLVPAADTYMGTLNLINDSTPAPK